MNNIGEFRFEYEQAEYFNEPNLSTLDVLEEIKRKEEAIPVAVFSGSLSPLASTVKYLHENKALSFSKIAQLLSRDQRTIWTEYSYTKNKSLVPQNKLNSSSIFIPISIFSNRKLSFLENLCSYLKLKDFSNKEISLILNKDQKTIWTVLHRASIKRGGDAK